MVRQVIQQSAVAAVLAAREIMLEQEAEAAMAALPEGVAGVAARQLALPLPEVLAVQVVQEG